MSKAPPRRPPGTPAPRIRWAPKFKTNDADDAIFLASSYGLAPDDWQCDILRGWLGRSRSGKWAAGRCGLAVPRQNGKNGAIEVRELFGMVALGEQILHTAHEVKTARKAFKRLKHFFGEKASDPLAPYPELNALVKEVRNTNGQEAIFLRDVFDSEGRFVRRGGSVEFVARSKGSGRGFTVDVLILDEAQALTDAELEAIRSSVSSAPLGNAQVIYTGTPPDRDKGQDGVVWLRIRSQQGKDRRLCWIEFGVPDGPLEDIDFDDVGLLFACNPALELRHANGAFGLQMDVIHDERGDLSPEGFARERYGWWGDPNESSSGFFSPGSWGAGADPTSSIEGSLAFGIAVSVDRQRATIGVSGRNADDQRHLEPVTLDTGTHWVVAEAKRLQDAHEPVTFAIDSTGPGADLIPKLLAAGVRVHEMTIDDVKVASAQLVDMVEAGEHAHLNDPELNAAVRAAYQRPIGDRFGIGRRKSTQDITPLEATAFAAWAAENVSRSVYEDRGLVTF